MTTATRRGTTSRARRSSRTEPSDVEEHDYRERTTDHSPAEQLRHRFTAVRLSLQWLGIRKTLSTDQRQQAAEPFAAQGESLSAAKKLLDTRHPAWKAVTAIRGQAVSYWKSISLPYPEPGLRLIRQSSIEPFNRRMHELQGELDEAVVQLDRAYGELRESARERLGRLYDASDYPPTLQGLFAIEWDFPSIEPPAYLQQLSPDIYQQEQRRIAARFDEAVQLAEEAFTAEFGQLVEHLTERLSGQGPDGKPKVFRDSAVGNLASFFERFRQLNLHSNAQLDDLIEQARQAVRGVAPQDLRVGEGLRQRVAQQLKTVQGQLDGLLVDRPRRRILRGNRSGGGEGEARAT